jgi:ketosteroid isomerase-like protein
MAKTISVEQVANRFFAAIEAADCKALDEIYTADAVVWHNYDNVEQRRNDNIAMLAKFPQMFKSFRYANIRRAYFEGGFVQQHVCTGVKVNGQTFEVPNCMVVTMRGDQIVRIDDYFDSAQDARPANDR